MGRRVLLVIGTILLVLSMNSVASAYYFPAIYLDFAADGVLDGTYTPDELRDYLNDPEVDQYGDPAIVSALDALVMRMLADDASSPTTTGTTGVMQEDTDAHAASVETTTGPRAPTEASAEADVPREEMPVTGMDAFPAVLGAIGLLMVGLAVRLLARPRA